MDGDGGVVVVVHVWRELMQYSFFNLVLCGRFLIFIYTLRSLLATNMQTCIHSLSTQEEEGGWHTHLMLK